MNVLVAATAADVIAMGMTIPVWPKFAAELGADPEIQGYILSAYAACQFLSGPFLGRLGDVHGRRPLLVISSVAALLGMVGMLCADSVVTLALSRALPGMLKCNMSMGQAWVADHSPPGLRSWAMARLGLAFGMGFIIGPALGGMLASHGARVPLYCSCVFLLINLILVAQVRDSPLERGKSSGMKEEKLVESMGATLRRSPQVVCLLGIKLSFSVAFCIFQTQFALWASRVLHFAPRDIGFYLAYIGCLTCVWHGSTRLVVGRFPERRLLAPVVVTMGCSLAVWGASRSLMVQCVNAIPLTMAGAFSSTILNSLLTQAAPDAGSVLGVSASLETISRAVAPLVSSLVFHRWGESHGDAFVGLTASAICFLGLPFCVQHAAYCSKGSKAVKSETSLHIG